MVGTRPHLRGGLDHPSEARIDRSRQWTIRTNLEADARTQHRPRGDDGRIRRSHDPTAWPVTAARGAGTTHARSAATDSRRPSNTTQRRARSTRRGDSFRRRPADGDGSVIVAGDRDTSLLGTTSRRFVAELDRDTVYGARDTAATHKAAPTAPRKHASPAGTPPAPGLGRIQACRHRRSPDTVTDLAGALTLRPQAAFVGQAAARPPHETRAALRPTSSTRQAGGSGTRLRRSADIIDRHGYIAPPMDRIASRASADPETSPILDETARFGRPDRGHRSKHPPPATMATTGLLPRSMIAQELVPAAARRGRRWPQITAAEHDSGIGGERRRRGKIAPGAAGVWAVLRHIRSPTASFTRTTHAPVARRPAHPATKIIERRGGPGPPSGATHYLVRPRARGAVRPRSCQGAAAITTPRRS